MAQKLHGQFLNLANPFDQNFSKKISIQTTKRSH